MKEIINNNHIKGLSYIVVKDNIEIPVLDITHPLFISSIDEKAYHQSNIKSQKILKLARKVPKFLGKRFIKRVREESTYSNELKTLIYKLGPKFTKNMKLELKDKWRIKQKKFMGFRIKLRDICNFQKEILIPQLKNFPGKSLCFFNIVGGTAIDSINTIFLIQQEEPDLLKNRRVDICILDNDDFGSKIAQKSIEALKKSTGRLRDLNVKVRINSYDCNKPEKLNQLLLEKRNAIQICSSYGGLFEYGDEDVIIKNLNELYKDATADMEIVGSLFFDKKSINPAHLDIAIILNKKINYLGLKSFNKILDKTNWVLDDIKGIDNIFLVFRLKKNK